MSTDRMPSCWVAKGDLPFQATLAGHRAAGHPPRPGLPGMEVRLSVTSEHLARLPCVHPVAPEDWL